MIDLRTASRTLLVAGLCVIPALLAGASSPATPSIPTPPAPDLPGQSVTLLPNGTWLMLGGRNASGQVTGQGVLVDSNQKRQLLAQPLNVPRAGHTATVLPDGTVLVSGGMNALGQPIADSERYHPDTQLFEDLGDTGLPACSGQTATLLSDGTLLIVGGVDASALVHGDSELVDPASVQGISKGATLAQSRTDHQARLLPTGDVLIWAGRDQNGLPLSSAELYSTGSRQFRPLDAATAALLIADDYRDVNPALVASSPQAGATDVSPTDRLALRFSKPLRPEKLTNDTVTLIGPNGTVATTVIAAEGGLLAFVTPKQSLLPASGYTLFVQGARDQNLRPVPFTTVPFHTAALPAVARASSDPTQPTSAQQAQPAPRAGSQATSSAQRVVASKPAAVKATATTPQPSQQQIPAEPQNAGTPSDSDGELWLPTKNNMHGVWRSGRGQHGPGPDKLPAAAPGVTAVSGVVIRLRGQPLSNVTLSIGNHKATTDGEGKFLLSGVPSGAQTLVIDGTTASVGGRQYGRYEYLANIESGKTNALPFVIWMTRLDTGHAVSIASPTTTETVVTNPRIPGLELHIPEGTVIRGVQGNNVTSITITAIPIDQPPFPLPNHWVPVYFTIQPGGAHLQGLSVKAAVGARLVYPNFGHSPPGTRIDFWNYDPTLKGWYVYGEGTVSHDGKQILPDPGVVIYEFSGAMVALPADAPATGPVPPGAGSCSTAGDPVDCFTGLYTLNRTDLYVHDVIPLVVQRQYRPADAASRGFGVGANLSYDMFIVGDTFPYTYANLILPDGSVVHYPRISSGTSYGDAVYQTQTPGPFFGSTIKFVGSVNYYWTLTLLNGTQYGFPEAMGQSNARCAAITGMKDRNGNALTFVRDGTCNLTSVTSPNGHTLSFTYDTSNRITQVTDDSGRKVTYSYNSSGTLASATDPAGKTEKYTYDSSNRLQTIADKRGNLVLTNAYDSGNRVTQQTYADKSTSTFSYTTNSSGVTTQTNYTDERGHVRQVQFNAAGYITSVTLAAGTPIAQTKTLVRNPTTNLAQSVSDALGRTTAYQYDANGNVTQITYLSGTSSAATWKYSYTATFAELASVTDPAGHKTSYTYDSAGNLLKTTDALGDVTTYGYNSSGQVTSVTRSAGGAQLTTTIQYNGGVPSSVVDALNRKTLVFNDALSRPETIQDALGNERHIIYDALDRVTQSTDPLGNSIQTGYDANGNLLTSTDANNVVQTFTYDARNRKHTYKDPSGKVQTYNYDGFGNITSIVDRKQQTTSVTYDALNRPTLVTYQDGSTLSITWDAGNRATQYVDSLNGTISRTYDLLDRLTQETTPQGQVTYTYDAGNRRKTMTVAGQSPVNYTFDNANRLTRVAQGTNAVAFGYDTAGRRTSVTVPNGIVGTFAFDKADELTAITYVNGSTQVGNLTYAYDAVGRRASVGGTLAGTVAPSAVAAGYDGANRLTNYGGSVLSYDADGNLATFGSATYSWNARNQLVATSAGNASFRYDALGRRTTATVNGTTSTYLYDGANPVAVNGSLLLASQDLDEIYAQVSSTATTSYLRDGLNSTVALTNSGGGITGSLTYSPYGGSSSSGSVTTAFQYTGRDNDGATGLYYYRARYYSPQLGRFISEDPAGLAAGTNFYAYVGGDPVSLIDPLGLCANQATASHCLWVAAQAKGVSIGLDILGAIPVVGNATSATTAIVRAGIAVDHGINSPIFALSSGAYGAYGAVTAGPEEATDSIVGAVSASAGIAATLADASLGGTEALPIVGNGLSALTGLWDGYQAYQIYQSCMAGN